MKNSAIIIIILIGLFSPGFSEEPGKNKIDVHSKIDRVVAYHDRALITRRALIPALDPGTYEIVVQNFPDLMHDNSVRTEIVNNNSVKILDVETKSYQVEMLIEKNARSLQETLKKMQEESKLIDDKIIILEFEKDYFYKLKNNYPRNFSATDADKGELVKSKSIKEYNAMLQFLMKKISKNFEKMRKEKNKLDDLSKRIREVRWKMNKLNISNTSMINKKMIRINLEIKEKNNFIIEISYIVPNVRWNPGYDIRVLKEEKKTEFIGYGVVSQRSREDWKNIDLAFSTAKPAIKGYLPELKPLYVVTQNKKKDIDALTNEQKNSKTNDNSQIGSLVFKVNKKCDIQADDSPHRTQISRHVFPVHFEYITIPRLSPYAFLQALGTNTMDTPILKGDLNIFIKNDFMGSAYTENILPGEKFELTLGINENIRIKRTLDELTVSSSGFLGNKRKLKYSYIIKIENFSKEEILLKIWDQIPVLKSEDIEIQDIEFSHKPADQSKNGILKWIMNIGPSNKVELVISFTLLVPKDKEPSFYKSKLQSQKSLKQIDLQELNLYDNEINQNKRKPMMKMMK